MKKFLFLPVLALFLISCDETGNGLKPNEERIPINISMSPLTKVSGNVFEEGDMVGLYVSNYNDETPSALLSTGNHVDNAKFTNNGSSWNPDEQLFWKDETTPADLYAYYPYSTVSDVNALAFSVLTDQSTIENYEGSYFLWGKVAGQTPTEAPVAIETNHLMSSVSVCVTYGENISEDERKLYQVESIGLNVKTTAEIDLTTGEVNATGNINYVSTYYDGEYYKAIVVPQESPSVSVKVNGKSYTSEYDVVLLPNTKYTLKINIEKDMLTSSFSFNIGEWEEDKTEYSEGVKIDNLASQIIEFTDSEVEAYCVLNYDTNGDGKLSQLEAATVKHIVITEEMMNNRPLEGKDFHELVYFTSLSDTSDSITYMYLHAITLPPSIETLGMGSYMNLESIKFTSLIPPTIDPYAFGGDGKGDIGRIWVPDESEDLYREALPVEVLGMIVTY